MPTNEDVLSREKLLWDYETVLRFLARDPAYVRVRDRAQSGVPTLSAQTCADVVATFQRRFVSPDKMALHLEELRTFRIATLDLPLAEAFGAVYPLCLARARNRDEAAPETWFVWQVALNRLYGCRILANDRARYTGLVAPEDLV